MKKFLCIEVLFIIAVLFSGCGFHIAKPERIGIKTSDEAVYNLSLANKSFKLGDFFDISSFLGNNSEESEGEGTEGNQFKYEIYSYNPTINKDKIQQFLLKMDLEKIQLDLSSSLNGTEIKANFSDGEGENTGLDFSKEIPIPEVNRREVKAVELGVNEKVNALVAITGVTGPKSDVHILFSDDKNGFDNITYQSGYMTIQENPLDPPESPMTGAIILKKGNVELSRANFSNGVANLPLDGVKIEKEGLSFTFTESTGVSFIATVNSSSKVKSAAGLTIEDAVPISASSSSESDKIPLGGISGSSGDSSTIGGIESYEIGEGSLSILLNLPPQWETGNQVTFDYTMTLSDAIEAELTRENPTHSLNNATFNGNSKLGYSVSGNFHLQNATLDFIDEDGNNLNPTITVDVSVTNIKSATLNLNTEIKMPDPQNIDLNEVSPDIVQNIKAILWDKCGFSISYINTLPAENKITINSSSDFFKLQRLQEPAVLTPTQVAAGAEPVATEITAFVNETKGDKEYKTLIGNNSEAGELSVIDVDAEINISGYDRDNHTLTIKNLVPGTTYKIAIEVNPILEWNTIWINTADRSQHDKMSTGLNLSSVFSSMEDSVGSDIANNLEFNDISLYLFAETPVISGGSENNEAKNFFESIKFNGIIKAYIGDENADPVTGTKEKYLLGSKVGETETKQNLEFKKGLNLNITEDKVVTTDIDIELGVSQNEQQRKERNIAELLNYKDEGSLCVSYDIGLQTGDSEGQIAISKAQLEQLKNAGTTSISLSVLCKIPLDFNVKDDIHMNLLKLIGSDKGESNADLLGRTEDPDYSQIKEFAKAIQYVKIKYQPSSLPFIVNGAGKEDGMSLIIDLDGEGGASDPKILKISGDDISVSPDEILQYPLCPTIELLIPKGTLLIPQEPAFATDLFLQIATSGETIWLDSIKSKQEGGNE